VKFLKFFQGKSIQPEAEQLRAYRRTGDVAVLGALYEPYMDLIFGVCYRYLRDEDYAKDAVMLIFEKLVVDLRSHEVTNLRSWLHSVAKNYCLMKLRAEKESIKMDHAGDPGSGTYSGNVVTLDEEAFTLDARLDALDDCLPKLAPKQRLAIELFYLEQKCYRDIAAQTGFEVSKVKSYIQNGKRNLKLCIESNGQL
jgi:RNA polymerase sigma factor (sigma-70 family)